MAEWRGFTLPAADKNNFAALEMIWKSIRRIGETIGCGRIGRARDATSRVAVDFFLSRLIAVRVFDERTNAVLPSGFFTLSPLSLHTVITN